MTGQRVEVTALRSWFASASPGERFTYATGAHCPRGPIVEEIRLLHDAGQLLLTQRRIGHGPDGVGQFEYVAIKRRDTRPPQSGFQAVRRPMCSLDDATQRVLMQVQRAQHFGEALPPTADIAKMAHISADAVKRILGGLQSAGKIQLRHQMPIVKTIKVKRPRRAKRTKAEARA